MEYYKKTPVSEKPEEFENSIRIQLLMLKHSDKELDDVAAH